MNQNENENETGEATYGGALRAPLAGSPAFVFAFMFDFSKFDFPKSYIDDNYIDDNYISGAAGGEFKFNVNQNENENKNASGGTCEGGAKRPPVGCFTRCVFVFVFVSIYV